MMKPLLSIIYLSYRPGSLDILVDSLLNQTEQNYELIVIDDYIPRKTIDTKKYLRRKKVPAEHVVRSKGKCFPELAYNLINAYNTGVGLSKGENIMILNDYTWLPPNAIERINENEETLYDGCSLSGVAEMYEYPAPPKPTSKFSVFKKDWKGHPATHGLTLRQMWIPQVFELFYSVIPWKVLCDINGFPECYDYAPNDQVQPFIDLCSSRDFYFGVDNELHCMMLDHRKWGKDAEDSELWHLSKKKPQGSTKLVHRENTFNLKRHRRGTML